LAVVGIIGILSLAADPVMRGLGGSQSSRAAGAILVGALEQTRTAAILSGTNAYLLLPGNSFELPDYRLRSYVIARPAMDIDGDGRDDVQPQVQFTNQNSTTNWVLLSKWEKLPGDLVFSPLRISSLTNVFASGISVPRRPGWSGSLAFIGFDASGALVDLSGTTRLLFASATRTNLNQAAVADRIEISRFSGRVRYAGITNNVNF